MNKSELALFGGSPAITGPLTKYNPLGEEEVAAACRVIESGVLSQFIGAWDKDFYGGPNVRAFEEEAASYFRVKHAVTVNSWTSGLICAIGALGIEPGDEVIVTPWTMAATATAILHWNAIPVFADIDPVTYNLSPRAIESQISPYTRAIVVADIFGQSADMDEIMLIARKHDLKVVSDSAQSPGATYKDRYAGTIAHVGGYSLNYHKHIHTGEGGIIVTDDDEIVERLQLIRNHAEAVVSGKGVENITNMIGHNFRLGEIECAIGREQLKKLRGQIVSRQEIASILDAALRDLPGLSTPVLGANRSHVYYGYAMRIDSRETGVSRDRIFDALLAEGVPVTRRYQNLHLLPLYQRKIAYGSTGFPWSSPICKREVSYRKGICPVAEHLNDFSFLGFGICSYNFDREDIKQVINGFYKVWSKLDSLASRT